MSLFQLGDFVLNSGAESKWKLECDVLTDDDIKALAEMIRQMIGPFSWVQGVPQGGLRLAKALEPFANPCCCTFTHNPHDYCDGIAGPRPHLIVDDVLTTGGSMELARDNVRGREHCRGAVVFARGQCPHWIKALFQMPEVFWIKPKTRGA